MGLTLLQFTDIVQQTFAIEPADKHTEAAILRMLKTRFPGEYSISLHNDNLGNTTFTIVFSCPVEATYFKLKYG